MSLNEQVINALTGLSVDVWHVPAPAPGHTTDPYVVFYRRDQGGPRQTYDLAGNRDLTFAGVHFIVYSKDDAKVQPVASEAIALLEAFSSPTVRRIFIRGRSEVFDERVERHGLRVETEFVTTED